MKEFVSVYTQPADTVSSETIFIEKNRPDWQKGRYNIPGGKLEENESIFDGAIRELKEETGFDLDIYSNKKLKIMGKIVGQYGIVHIVRIPVLRLTKEFKPREGETERVFWSAWEEIKDSKLLIPNLKVMIPLIMADISDWTVTDDEVSGGTPFHTFSMTVKTGH